MKTGTPAARLRATMSAAGRGEFFNADVFCSIGDDLLDMLTAGLGVAVFYCRKLVDMSFFSADSAGGRGGMVSGRFHGDDFSRNSGDVNRGNLSTMAAEKVIAPEASGMIIDGCGASEAVDSSAEVLSIKGADLSELEEGRGLINYEHLGHSDDKVPGMEIVGRITYCKKIYKASDCEDDRQKLFWDKVKLPFIYIRGRLLDAAGHPGAAALAAEIRDHVANGEPYILGWSVEGSTISKKGNLLEATAIRRVSLTNRACNKTAVLGVLADPQAPPGFEKYPEGKPDLAAMARKAEDPLLMRLGGFEMEYGPDVLKAMTAGSYAAAPGSLSGGSALQVEDRGLRASALAAFRDWDRKKSFKKFLKNRLPEVSDEFLDHFTDMVENHITRVQKSVEVVTELAKAQKKVKKQLEIPGTEKAASLTVLGKPVEPNPKLRAPKFDEKTGTLHTPRGSFRVYIPGHDTPEARAKFQELMNDPKVEQFHGYAMENWAKAHKLLKAGQLPPEVGMHAVLFSNLSPNTPVPTQENMFGHLVDAMKHTGVTPMSADAPQLDLLRRDWLNRDQPAQWPEHSREHFHRLEAQLRLKADSSTTGRKKGEISSYMLANDKFKNMSKYQDLHGHLMDVLDRHRADGRAAASEMMAQKHQAGLWNNRRRLGLAAGKPDIGDFPGGPEWGGLAPKTSRYALGMMGAGNCLDAETEALTQRGWVRGFDLDEDDILLTKNAETGVLEWQKPTSLNFFPDYEGPLVEIKSRSFSAVTTPDHRWLVTTNKGVVKEKTSASLTRQVDRIHRTGNYRGPEVSGLSPDEAELLGWFVTDGFFEKKKRFNKNGEVRHYQYACICQSPEANKEKCVRISALINRLDSRKEVTTYQSHGIFNWRLGPALTSILVARAPDRCLTVGCMLDLNREALERLKESMFLGDGTLIKSNPKWKGNKLLYTGRKEQADAFQALLAMTGRASSSRKWAKRTSKLCPVTSDSDYRVLESNREFTSLRDGFRREFSGKEPVWCPTVPNGFFVARRMGFIFVTGNSIVPDTHFVRYLFGLDKGKDTESIKHLKELLWNPQNSRVLEGLDRYFAKHHDSVEHMVNHPKWGPTFENREDAVFPAFWKTWMGIVPHEKSRGLTTGGFNELTDHKPYWEAIAPHLNKAESPHDLPMRMAIQHAEWAQQYGAMPAQQLYFRYLLPQLLEAGLKRKVNDLVQKFENLSVEFRALEKVEAGETGPETVRFQDKDVRPGKAKVNGLNYHLLSSSPTEFIGIPSHLTHTVGSHRPEDLVRIPRGHRGVRVFTYPEDVSAPGVVDVEKHGVGEYNHHPDVKSLVHGLDFNGPRQALNDPTTYVKGKFWTRNAEGKRVLMKPAPDDQQGLFTEARREGLYHNLARDFFGMGQYLPRVGVVRHPQTGQEFAAVEAVDGDHYNQFRANDPERHKHLKALGDSGELDKAALMNMIMANGDRHQFNWLMSEDGKMKLIDHGAAFDDPGSYKPNYWSWYHDQDEDDPDTGQLLHPEARNWALGLKPDELDQQMRRHGVPENRIQEAVTRLRALHQHLKLSPASTAYGAYHIPQIIAASGVDSGVQVQQPAPFSGKMPSGDWI